VYRRRDVPIVFSEVKLVMLGKKEVASQSFKVDNCSLSRGSLLPVLNLERPTRDLTRLHEFADVAAKTD